MSTTAEALPDVSDLTYDELDALGCWLTEQIRRADQVHDRELVEELVRAKNQVAVLKNRT